MLKLNEKYVPTQEEKAAVHEEIKKIRESQDKYEVLDLVVKAISRQAAAATVVEAGIEHLNKLGLSVQECAQIAFGAGRGV